MAILLYFLSAQMWTPHLSHCPALQFTSLPLYRSCHQGYVPQKHMQLLSEWKYSSFRKSCFYEMFGKCSFIETLFQLHANSSMSEGFENNKNGANETIEENNQKNNNTESVTVKHHHHQHVHYHQHQHVHHHHHHHQNKDSDVTSVPKEPISHSHQEHSHHHKS